MFVGQPRVHWIYISKRLNLTQVLYREMFMTVLIVRLFRETKLYFFFFSFSYNELDMKYSENYDMGIFQKNTLVSTFIVLAFTIE